MHMKTLAFVFLMVSLTWSCSSRQQDYPESLILQSMQKQEEAWNKGDIRTFMETYWQDDSLLFVGSNGPVYGWQNTLNRYLTSYPDTAAMGRLHFDILQMTPLQDEHYFVLGKWLLTRSIGDLSGHFTLIFRKINGQWLIVSDHSS